jgi:hypothetical protein
MMEPELITIVEGPTPDFRPSDQLWLYSALEGPEDSNVYMCELRTMNGEAILARCRAAWKEGRPVRLEFPDEMRSRQQLDVAALRLYEVPEGKVLNVWVRQPVDAEEAEEEFDEGDDDFGF